MLRTRIASSIACLAVGGFALVASAQEKTSDKTQDKAQDKKPVAPAAAAKTMAPVSPASPAKPAAPKAGSAAPVAPAAGAPPAAPAGPPLPAPSKDLEAFMKGFEGGWRCDSKFPAGAMGPGTAEVTLKSTVRITKQFGGLSWHGEYALPKSKTMPAVSGIFQVAYDASSNQATIVSYDNMGSASLGIGPISGDAVAFTEDAYMMGAKLKVRETMTKKSPKEVVHKYEVDMGKGFQLMGEDTCKR